MTKYLLLILGVLLTACNPDTFLVQTDPNAVASFDYYRTENDVLLGLNGVYQSLRNNNGIAEGSSLFSEERSDNTGRNDAQSNAGEPFQFNDFSLLASNSNLRSHWGALYQTITRSNQVLAGMETVTFSAANANLKLQYAAEAKFLRALMYFHLVRKFGDVPLVTSPLNTADEVKASTFRVKRETVYAQIVTDLQEAAASPLPNLQPLTGKGRVSKAAANALLGQVYLTMATTLDAAGRADNLNRAKAVLTTAYSMRTFGLLREIPYADVFDVTKKSTNAEVIFQIVYRQGDANYASSIAANNQAQGETVNSLRPATGPGANVTPDLVKDYEEGDLRKDFSIKYANAANVRDWFVTKFRDASAAAGVLGYGGNDWTLIRYADVILMLAETNQLLGDEMAAIALLDQVRDRAKMPLYAASRTNASYNAKYPTLKLAILHERRVELAFENHRWFDLLRAFSPVELAAYFQAKSQPDFGAARLINVGTKDYFYPIPLDEVKLNPERMYQNPGY
jgi:hypothetical protein